TDKIKIDIVFRHDANRAHIVDKGPLAVGANQNNRRRRIASIDTTDSIRVHVGILKGSNQKVTEGIISQTTGKSSLATKAAEHGRRNARQTAHGHIDRGHEAQGTPFREFIYRLRFYVSAHATYSNKITGHTRRPWVKK